MQNWASGLTERGHRVQVITLTRNLDPDKFPFEVFRCLGQFGMWRLMREADVIIQFNVSLKAILPCFLSFKPLIISHHSTNVDVNGNWVKFGKVKQFIANHLPRKNIACSAYVAQQMRNAVVVNNPYDSMVFKMNNGVARDRDVLFVGRLVSDKGCDVLIRSLAILKTKFSLNVRLTIVGEGPERNNLGALALSQGISEQIDFVGKKSGIDLADEFNKHKVVVVPSVWDEPFGIVAIEGLSCGCQVVVSKAGGLPEAVGKFGLTVERGNPDQLAAKLNSIFRNEIGTLRSKHDLDEFLSKFSISSSVSALEAEIFL